MKVERLGIIHAYAQCTHCNWSEGMDIKSNNRMSQLRSKISTHIKNTGHTVCLETGNSTYYRP